MKSDTREEKALKKIPFFFRLKAKKFIWTNQSDWGYYKVSNSNPCKGIPKYGFDVGTVNELQNQAYYGGYRIPGGVFLESKQHTHNTVTDLSQLSDKIIFVGCLIRIRDQIFQVKNIGENTIKFDRKWRAKRTDGTDTVLTSDIMYRVPSSPHEPHQLFYKSIYKLSKFGLNSSTAKFFYKFQRQSALLAAGRCLQIGRFCESVGLDRGAIDWRICAERCIDVFNWADRFLKHS